MEPTADHIDQAKADAELAALERRLWRNMAIALSAAVLGSVWVAPWRVTTGLLLGGVLAFLNHHWLRRSLAAFLDAETGQKWHPARYLLRYFGIGLIVYTASLLNLVSVPATIAGLCAFAAALMLEALAQIFSTLTQREEI